MTTCAQGSFHTEVIDLVGAVNCAEMENAGSGFTEISFEQLLNWQPDVVLLDTQSMVDAAPTDALWKELTAVQNGQVYKIPTEPYSFLDQPPASVSSGWGISSIQRFMTMIWSKRYRIFTSCSTAMS